MFTHTEAKKLLLPNKLGSNLPQPYIVQKIYSFIFSRLIIAEAQSVFPSLFFGCCVCRIMRAGSPRHTLMPTSGPTTNAIAAFNRPKEAQAAQTDGKGTNLNLLNLTLFTLMFMIHAVINFTLKKPHTNEPDINKPHTNKLYV